MFLYRLNVMATLDPKVWGPHYWFFLLTTAINYPDNPNEVTRKKYYEFIQNFPMFIPDITISADFSKLLDKYPVTPYLDNRTSFIKWVHFIHNRINTMLNKDEVSLGHALEAYYLHYKPPHISILEELQYKEKLVYFSILVGIGYVAYYLYSH
jgi:hypothetical protein